MVSLNAPQSEHDKQNKQNKHIIALAEKDILEGTVSRLLIVGVVACIGFLIFGFGSFKVIQSYNNSLILVDNIWPRVVFLIVPMTLVLLFLNKKEISARKRILLFVYAHAFLFFVSSCIYVWPIAWFHDPSIMLYMLGANSTFLCASWTIMAIPKSLFKHVLVAISVFILAPIVVVATKANGLVQNAIIGDTAFATGVGMLCGHLLSGWFREVAIRRAQQIIATSQFLGNKLLTAIIDGDSSVFEERKIHSYVFFLDIRNSTVLQKKYGELWEKFNAAWITSASEIIEKNGGHFVKSSGDGILGAFGVFDESGDLENIQDFSSEVASAEKTRLSFLLVHSLECLDNLFAAFRKISMEMLPDENVVLCGGLDRGKIKAGLRGGDARKEFDIWGDTVNISAKLESSSKTFLKSYPDSTYLLIVSPYAADFLVSNSKFSRKELGHTASINGIKWVYVREYLDTDMTNIKSA